MPSALAPGPSRRRRRTRGPGRALPPPPPHLPRRGAGACPPRPQSLPGRHKPGPVSPLRAPPDRTHNQQRQPPPRTAAAGGPARRGASRPGPAQRHPRGRRAGTAAAPASPRAPAPATALSCPGRVPGRRRRRRE